MNTLCSSILTVLLSLLAFGASAHIDLNAVDGADCSNAQCKVNTVFLTSGSKIEVVYDVEIVHNTNVKILFIDKGETTILAENLPEPPGLTSVEVTLPDVECDTCILKVEQSVYTGTANINLSKDGWVTDTSESGQGSAAAINGSFLLFGWLYLLVVIRRNRARRAEK